MFGDKTSYAKMKGFNENFITYAVVGPNTYEIKDELKNAGFKFAQPMGWHSDKELKVPDGYSLVPLNFDECYDEDFEPIEKLKWKLKRIGQGLPAEEAPQYPDSQFVGEIGERIRNIPARLISTKVCKPSAFGTSTCCLFESGGNIFQWFTTSSAYRDYDINENLLLTGTVKNHSGDYYGNSAVTVLSRCILKPIE